MDKKLLTIQDISCFGQCSLTVALPVISACGIETVILPSAVLSTHTAGFTGYTFRDLTGDMADIEKSWIANNLKFDAFYTGYVCESQIDPILHIMESCAADGALRIVDPVMADHGKMYPGFGDDFPKQMRRLCNGADYLLPNLTEAAFLLGEECRLEGYDRAYIEGLVERLHSTGAKNIVLTGVSYEPGLLGCAVSDGNKIEYDFNKRLTRSSHGTGDLFASVFAGALMRGKSGLESAAIAADAVCLAIEATPDEHWYGVCFEKIIPELTTLLK
ncbi:MAG: bifunctional hydroxymethylpyrimidine kinase/phosphomethylpyrimidine kinase [Lentisphaeria bacterium]|nr:phosphomethylpyrimidine kinase [Lentisphaerota bacterium]MBR2632381.1 bifunctional hydroxymethylpyrimidine kinase/phosphomethylpyrimidine kinase [Lentisphaeria bacterium]